MAALVDAANRALRRVPTWPLYLAAPLPSVWWFHLALAGRLGADPVASLTHQTGLLALQLLVATLAVTPLREQVGLNVLRFRRFLGLAAFFYAALHFLIWLGLDRQFDWPRLLPDLVKRPYILLGFTALLMLLPLAATSFDGAIRRMGGRAWRQLHRLAYPAALLAAAHFVWLVKSWPPEPLAYLAAIVLLLAYRLRPKRRPAAKPATA
jgi:sulfoxide reductase heme-binding subunit YedZ